MTSSQSPVGRQRRLGKYRIVKRVAFGQLATVYRAYDTVEGTHVALKIFTPQLSNEDLIAAFRQEVRLTARLDHPNIMTIKNAGLIDGLFVVSYPLGQQSLADRVRRRLSTRIALHYSGQLLEALAYAHRRGVIHCDVKPENVIIFPEHRIRLTDFGLAKIAMRTLRASGSGTVGYVAPDQAMGRPSRRSDVFSAGLVIYRTLAGVLPEGPFRWPLPARARLRKKIGSPGVDVLRRALEVDPHKRFKDADRRRGESRNAPRD